MHINLVKKQLSVNIYFKKCIMMHVLCCTVSSELYKFCKEYQNIKQAWAQNPGNHTVMYGALFVKNRCLKNFII